ncbi:MAG: phytanoyl-CoA hydroxylase [Yoonia sp.]|jgi:ectoine hydroxylase-related dioxygenase (phytanoyl-CoA dioxygenase family)
MIQTVKQILDKEFITAFEKDGYVVLRNFLSENGLETMRQSLRDIFGAYALPGEDVFATVQRLATTEKELFYRIYKFIAQSFVSLYPVRLECLPVAQRLLGGKLHIDIGSAVIFALPSDERLTWDWHQESPYDPDLSETIHFSFPLFEPATEDNGTMSVLLGSHKLGMLPHDKVQKSSDSATSLVPCGIETISKDYDALPFVANVGDLAVFHNDIIHRSNNNISGKPRITGLVRIARIEKLPKAASWIDGRVY